MKTSVHGDGDPSLNPLLEYSVWRYLGLEKHEPLRLGDGFYRATFDDGRGFIPGGHDGVVPGVRTAEK